jgi:GntR family transcriptional regulator/MocR family aminotransferase
VRKTWASSGLDLHLDLRGQRLRAGLEGALRTAVRAGRLRPGMQLPSSRALARDLGLSRNTVAEAYSQLVAEGWLATRQGSGTAVAHRPSSPPAKPGPTPGPRRRQTYDLRAGVPNLAAFPRSAWLAASRRALALASPDLLGYGHPQGLPDLRIAIADYLSRVRGVLTTPERVVICAGFAQGLELLCRALRTRRATTVVTEVYGYGEHVQLIESAGLKVTTVDVDRHGAVVDRLGRADAVLLTPAHQFPTGVPLAPERRRAVVQWAVDNGALIIEDDYDGEFRYDRQPLGAMQALAPEQVVYAGTASKSLVPGLRLAWLALPGHLVDDFLATKTSTLALSGAIDQLTLAEFIKSGRFDRQVRQQRLAYRRRRDRLVKALGREVPGMQITGIAAGLQALLPLADGQQEDEIVKRALGHGLIIEGLGAFTRRKQKHPPALVVGYAKPADHAFSSAVARLCAVLRA